MAIPFSPGKLFLFVISNLVVGLLQVWVLYLALATIGKEHNLPVLLGDGGLFFFSTSLIVNSTLVLLAQAPGKLSTVDIVFIVLTIAGSLIGSIVVYAVVLTTRLGTVAPFHDHIGAQLSCACAALVFAFFVGVRTGYFVR